LHFNHSNNSSNNNNNTFNINAFATIGAQNQAIKMRISRK
jgi:hypothetical protein